MRSLWQDVVYAARLLGKNAGFAAVAIVTLALGIGANSALFSVVSGVLLSPLPFQDPDKLISVYAKTSTFDESSVSYLNFLDWKKDNRSFSALAAYRGDDYNLTGMGEPERLHIHMVSAEFLPVLGMQPMAGRNFRAEEDLPGAEPVAILGDGLWKRRFGGSASVVGQNITLNGKSYTVVGVAKGSLPLVSPSDVYVPIGQWNDPTFRDRRIGFGTRAVGRLKAGVSLEQAKADMSRVAENLAATYPDADKGMGIALVPLKTDVVGDVRGTLLVLLGAVSFVLLIACANVANLLLARSTGRAREFAIRAALGAGPWRVIRQLLTESVLLSIAGGLLGLAVAKMAMRTVLTSLGDALPRANEIELDWRVLLFTAALSIVTGIVFGLVPAMRLLRPKLNETMNEAGGRGSSGKRHRLQKLLVVSEMALAVVLLIGAGLMIRSIALLWSINPGFEARNAMTFNVALSPSATETAGTLRAKYREGMRQLSGVPGVQAISMIGGSLPMTGDSELPFWREGQARPQNQADMTFGLFYLVTPGYTDAMKIPIQNGRFFAERDDEHGLQVVVIDAELARKYFPNEDPVGKHLNLGLLDMQPQIIGVAGHVEHWGLGATGHQNLQAQIYLPVWQVPDRFWPLLANGAGYVARTSGATQGLGKELREATMRFDASAAVYGMRPMEEIVAASISGQRMTMILLSVFSALALVLSAIGIYGVISYLVGQRTHEIGIRVALGASRKDVLRMVLGDGMSIALAGAGIGLAAALGLTRLIAKMIYGVSAVDPLTFGGVAVLLMAVALLACYVPARRAMSVDPIVILRYE
ncbi:MAG TPA: ABC transporter permease [Candidatus Dormibacteraeota bacterium]|nr:ABC transporter permease [Candidatus Dormibacteraeota bacterium]